jgi:hypothetical protein
MLKQRKTPAVTAICLVWLILTSGALLTPAQSRHKPSQDESTKAIRASAYAMMKAFLTQDVPTFKRNSAKRTLDLIDLAYEAARQDPVYQQELQKAHIANSDQFLGYFLLGMANQYLQAIPLSPEAAAIRVSKDSTVSFISDSEARIAVGDSGFARARLVARVWKIDLTDWLKKAVLKEIKDPDLRARIKSL